MPQFQKGNKFGSKSFAERYRWTEDEKREVLAELQSDVTISPKPKAGWIALTDVPATEKRFNQMGHFKTGFRSLDALTLGFDRGEYVVLGAPTNGGKTQLATYIAATQAAAGVKTMYISRELNNSEMLGRFTHIGAAMDNIDLPENNRMNPEEVISLVTDFAAANPGCFVVIDHLHAFYRGDKMTEALGSFSASLRELAQDLGITILALSQFNRQPYTLEDGPTNYHLKESGYIADDAYTIILAWRHQGMNIKLTKTRRLDLEGLSSKQIVLVASDGLLSDQSTGLQQRRPR